MKNKKLTYLMYDGRLYKIGESVNPQKRLKTLKTANPFCELVCYGDGVSEKYLHKMFFQKRRNREWFELDDENLEKVKRLIKEGETQEGEWIGNAEYESIEINGVKFKGKKKSGKWFTLSDREIARNVAAKQHSVELNKKYVIKYGKHKGKKIVDMTSPEEFQYCKWYFKEKFSDISKNQKKKDREYKAFSWWIRIGYNKYNKDKSLKYDNEKGAVVFESKESDLIPMDYVIDFGKYNGIPIVEMKSEEQKNYCKWIHSQMLSKREDSDKFRAFDWWIKNMDN